MDQIQFLAEMTASANIVERVGKGITSKYHTRTDPDMVAYGEQLKDLAVDIRAAIKAATEG